MALRGIVKMSFWHWLVIAMVVAFVADWLVQRPDGRARQINAAMETRGSAA